jgi:uncharacterized protein (UPF0128 family)
MCIEIQNTDRKLPKNRKLFAKTIPGTKIFRENFRENENFRKLFSRKAKKIFREIFAKIRKRTLSFQPYNVPMNFRTRDS